MGDTDQSHGSYIRRVSEETRRYTHDLLEENERLRGLAAALTTEEQRLTEELHTAQALARERAERVRVLEEERRSLEDQLTVARQTLELREREQERLRHQLTAIDKDNQRYLDQFADLEQQNTNLANLYVASYRLHETLERSEVVGILQEIMANLIGTEEMALFDIDEDRTTLRLSASFGIQPESYELIPMGQGHIGRVAASGERYIAGAAASEPPARGEEHLTACIPLKLGGRVIGTIAIFRLLPQKSGLAELDFELFDLLASQAAMALYSTGLHARLAARAQ